MLLLKKLLEIWLDKNKISVLLALNHTVDSVKIFTEKFHAI